MEKRRKKGILLLVVFLLVFAAALVSDRLSWQKEFSTEINRNEIGEGDTEITVLLNAEDDLENYSFTLTVPEQIPTEEEALQLFSEAEEEIDASVFRNQDANQVTGDLCLKDSYADGKVSADWSFLPYGYFDEDGKRTEGEVPKEGIVISVEVDLKCGSYREIYDFSFKLYPEEKTAGQQIIADINDYIDLQGESTGKTVILPSAIDGVSLDWGTVKSHTAIKVGIFELVIGLLLVLLRREKEKENEKNIRRQMREDYPELVSRLSILLGSGMNLKQAWNRISARYTNKREKGEIEKRPGFEAVLKANNEISSGESERIAIQHFGEEADVSEYFRLSRLLIRNRNKGSRGIGELLNRECTQAFEIRKNTAKKLGEEAGTKMLLPLILMLCIVMVIVIAPAIMSFHG